MTSNIQNHTDIRIGAQNPVDNPSSSNTNVTENKIPIFENSVLQLKIRVLNDTQRLQASRTVQSFGDCFTANMEEKGFFGKIAQFFTNIGLYRQEPEKLLRNVEKSIDALGELIRTQANSNGKITSTVIGNISGCIETFANAVENIARDQNLPEFIRDGFRELYKKDIFKVQRNGFLREIAEGIKIAQRLNNLETEEDCKILKALADKVDTCEFIQKDRSHCHKQLYTALANQFSRITGDFLNKAKTFVTSFNNDIKATLEENGELSDEKCEELNGRFLEFTGKIRPFCDALMSSKVENEEPECLQKFKSDCRQTLAKFEALPKNVEEHGYEYMKYTYLNSFPYFVNREAENARKGQIKAQKT